MKEVYWFSKSRNFLPKLTSRNESGKCRFTDSYNEEDGQEFSVNWSETESDIQKLFSGRHLLRNVTHYIKLTHPIGNNGKF